MGRKSGFNLIELIVLIGLVAIGLGLAIPAFTALLRNQQITTGMNRLIGGLHVARREAVTASVPTVVCPGTRTAGCRSDGVWRQGWLVFRNPDYERNCVDADKDGTCDNHAGRLTRVAPALEATDLTLTGSGNLRYRVAYQPSGFATGYAGSFNLCSSLENTRDRGITLALSGRVRPSRKDEVSCP